VRKVIIVLGAVLLALGLLVLALARPASAATPPATLGIYVSAENSGSYSTVAGQHPNVANDYLAWGNSYPSSFFATAISQGATPFLEIEPWEQAQGSNTCSASPPEPSMTTIGANGAAVQAYARGIGSAVAAQGKPVIITFAHEFNINGQYPWQSQSCEGTTPAQWVKAWDAVEADVNSTANGLASFMWAPNVDPNGNTTVAAQYWPGASEVQMTGVDGYPAFCGCGGTFADIFGGTFAEIHALTSLPVFISETDLSVLGTTTGGTAYESIPAFISDMKADGGSGVLQFQDGTPALTTAQWSALDTALGSTSPPPPPPGTPVLCCGHATPVAPTRENTSWGSTVQPGRWKAVITGPGAINGFTNTVPVPQADYTGLESGHTYTVTVQQLMPDGSAWGSPGKIVFVTEG
jgi:hypothetical protein